MSLRLSVLDQSPIRAGATPAQALAESVALAQRADALGYERYWVAEHHGSSAFAGSSPEIMITRIAAATHRIRVGSGGVMLVHYSPYKVAENFKVLESLFPDRIDLGIGRAPGSDGLTAAALAYGSTIGIDYFPAKVGDLCGFLDDSPPLTEAFAQVRATPSVVHAPPVWVLGSSDSSALLAGHFGLPFSFAHFINARECASAIATYRASFRPSARLAAPQVNIGVFVLCADSAEEAEHMAACRDLWRLRAERGEFGGYPSVEEALSYPYTPAERAQLGVRRARQILGNAGEVRARLLDIATEHAVDELMILSITPLFEQRIRCYELLAAAFGLEGSAPTPD